MTSPGLTLSMLRLFLAKVLTIKDAKILETLSRGLATYASSMSFGHPEHCFLTVWTPKSLGQDLLMMTILEDTCK